MKIIDKFEDVRIDRYAPGDSMIGLSVDDSEGYYTVGVELTPVGAAVGDAHTLSYAQDVMLRDTLDRILGEIEATDSL